MFTAIERLNVTRDYMEVPDKSCCNSGIRISVTLYKLGKNQYHLIRAHYLTSNLCGLTPSCGDTEHDYVGDFEDLDEALTNFSTQCVKAFTQQITWYTEQANEIKVVNHEN